MKIIISVILVAWCDCQQIVDLSVPLLADPRRAAELRCHFSMGEQTLHSVKWYCDQHEIFRYIPSQTPTIRVYNVSGGVSVLGGRCERDWCEVRVLPLPQAARSQYSCEVSSEGPRFHIATKTKHMTTAVYTLRDPVISGAPLTARPGEPLQLNCSTDYSLPPANIRWLVNGQPHEDEVWTRTEVSEAVWGGLRTSWRALRVRTPPAPAPAPVGILNVTCAATLPHIAHTLPLPPVERAVSALVTVTADNVAHRDRYVSNQGTAVSSRFHDSSSSQRTLFISIVTLMYKILL